MSHPTVPQFWCVSYPLPADANGLVSYWQEMADTERDARRVARIHSHGHGHATVTNREGLVATYVNGELWNGQDLLEVQQAIWETT